MVYSGIFATLQEVTYKSGNNAPATSSAETYVNFYMKLAESQINILSEYNWSDAYAALNVDVKGILSDAASSLAAIYVLSWDPNGQDGAMSRQEFEERINVLRDSYLRCIGILRDLAKREFMQNA